MAFLNCVPDSVYERINVLDKKIDDLNVAMIDAIPGMWELRGTNRLVTKGYLSKDIIHVAAKPDQVKIAVEAYDSSDTYVGTWDGDSFESSVTWFDEVSMPTLGDYKFKIVAARTDDTADITTDYAKYIYFSVASSKATDTTLTMSGVPADAKAVGDNIDAISEDINRVSQIGISSNYADRVIDISVSTCKRRVLDSVTYAGKGMAYKNGVITLVDSAYSDGLAKLDLSSVIDRENIVISALARSNAKTVTFAVFDASNNVLFVGTPENLGIEADTENKFIRDYTIPSSAIPENASFMLVSFWRNEYITWEHPYVMYTGREVTGTTSIELDDMGLLSKYNNGTLEISMTSNKKNAELNTVTYAGKGMSYQNGVITLVDSAYSDGLAKLDLSNVIDKDNIVISALARSNAKTVTFAVFDASNNVLFVGRPQDLGIEADTENKFIRDYTIPSSAIPENASFMLVSFWRNEYITWEHPYVKYVTGKIEDSTSVVIDENAKAEYVEYEFFDVVINKNVLPGSDLTVDSYTDTGMILLPKQYSKTGKPTRLVISCHGSGAVVDIPYATTELRTHHKVLLKAGYAIMDVNGGIPDSRHYNAPFVIQSYIKAYKYVTEKYNLYKDVFILGGSMGGLPSFTLANLKTIPVRALAGFCPVVDMYRQAWCRPWYSENGDYSIQRKRIASYFGFPDGFSDWNTSRDANSAEKQYFLNNIDKIKGYSPILFGAVNGEGISTLDGGDYTSLIKISNIPTKIWQGDKDDTVSPLYGQYLIDAIKRGGGIAEHVSYDSSSHSAGWGEAMTYEGISCHHNDVDLLKWFGRWE